MPSEIAPHHGEELWGLPYSLAQLARMYEDGADLGGCLAARSDIGRAERTESLQFQRIAFSAARKALEQC